MERFRFTQNGILRLLPGFRFHPTDEELVVHYLIPKIHSIPLSYQIPEADVCRSDPWTLPGDSEQERYFFCPVEPKYPFAKRINRTAPSGHWRPTSLDKQVVDSRNKHVGSKKTFVFYKTKPANGSKMTKIKTDWFMHEYKLANPVHGLQNWVVCRVFLKKGAKKDDVQVQNLGAVFYVPRDFDLNVDGACDSSSCGSSGDTVADEAKENSN